jgi:hypothetical protein
MNSADQQYVSKQVSLHEFGRDPRGEFTLGKRHKLLNCCCCTLHEGSRKYTGALFVGYQGLAGLFFVGRVDNLASSKKLWRGLQKIKRPNALYRSAGEK